MITILTPSKTMDFETAAPDYAQSAKPEFHRQAEGIRSTIGTYSIDRIEKLMSVSEALAQKVHLMYKRTELKQAFWAYDGDVFKGVQAKTLTEKDALFAQDHVLVPSAVYGLVRPFDMIAPYRLEMKAKFAMGDAKNLYELWGDRLGTYIETRANHEVLMLSSYEYAKAILPYLAPATRVVTPAFIDKKPDGTEAQVAIYNKMMRGVMGRWVIDKRIDALEDIYVFCAHGYAYSKERSSLDRPVFYREVMTPLKFD